MVYLPHIEYGCAVFFLSDCLAQSNHFDCDDNIDLVGI